MYQMTTESEKTVEQQACERLIDQIIRTAKNDLDLIRMDDIIFLMQYMATHLVNDDTQFEDPFVYHLKIASALTTAQPYFVDHFVKLIKLLCNLVCEVDAMKVEFLSRLLNKWHLWLVKIPAQQRQELSSSLCRIELFFKWMVTAGSFSLQLTMLDILYLYVGNLMTCLLRNIELPGTASKYIKSNSWIDTLNYKQNLLSSINKTRHLTDLILSKPLRSVEIGQTLTSCSGQDTWLHWNQRFGTFEFWMAEMKVTIFTNQLKQLEMKRDELGLVFTLDSPPQFENRFGKQIHPAIFQANVVVVSTESRLACEWWHPLHDMFRDMFSYEKIQAAKH